MNIIQNTFPHHPYISSFIPRTLAMAEQQLSQGNLPVFDDDLVADRTRQFVEFLDDEVSAFFAICKMAAS